VPDVKLIGDLCHVNVSKTIRIKGFTCPYYAEDTVRRREVPPAYIGGKSVDPFVPDCLYGFELGIAENPVLCVGIKA
jgi:hypothetical protein